MPPWTYSRLENFSTCPKQFYHLKVAKDVPDPPTVHTEWGHRVHEALEALLLHRTPLPEGMKQWTGVASKVAKLPGQALVEYKMAIGKDLRPAEWDKAWSRGIADYACIGENSAIVADWKTGKVKPSEQLAVYAAYVFAHYPKVETVFTAFVWLKEKKMTKEKFTRDKLHEIWQTMLPRVNKLESAYERDSWPAKPSGLCAGWCSVTSCEFNKRKK